ncbi:MAG: hypothetical protein JWP94_490 [Mucilaginibacter sp.]|nr:hypothetical protein [Mucilaginibacter sp.]
MEKISITVGLGDFYSISRNGLQPLPFVYKNVTDLQTLLETKNWTNSLSLMDPAATVALISTKLTEVIDGCKNGDEWVLFYYTGHATKYFLSVDPLQIKTMCVTYNEQLTPTYTPDIKEFFSEDNFQQVIASFRKKVPNGHLIAILDCCYAYGLIGSFAAQQPFLTVIAASATDVEAGFDTNSFFFKAFSQLTGTPFDQLQSQLDQIYQQQGYNGQCQVSPAPNFKSLTL